MCHPNNGLESALAQHLMDQLLSGHTCPHLKLVPCQGNKRQSELFLPENQIKELWKKGRIVSSRYTAKKSAETRETTLR